MTPNENPGQALRRTFDDALAAASVRLGKKLSWDEHEVNALSAATRAADRRAQLQKVYDAELTGQARPTTLVRLSAEMRMLEKATADHLGRVRIGPGVAKSERHQRAASARWDRERELRGTVDGQG